MLCLAWGPLFYPLHCKLWVVVLACSCLVVETDNFFMRCTEGKESSSSGLWIEPIILNLCFLSHIIFGIFPSLFSSVPFIGICIHICGCFAVVVGVRGSPDLGTRQILVHVFGPHLSRNLHYQFRRLVAETRMPRMLRYNLIVDESQVYL